MSPGPRDLRAIYEAALEIDDARERDSYVRETCGDHVALRTAVERLFRPSSSRAAAPSTDRSPCLTERQIGPYKILQRIGEGRGAVVYMAEQEEPIRRRVALKVSQATCDGRELLAQIEANCDALKQLDHPGIVRLLDVGLTESGRPFFVTELVKGLSITNYCEAAQLSVRGRLAFFVDVCRAVQHAHEHGVTHGDLKVSNLLVTLRDDRPVVKVTDFGIPDSEESRSRESESPDAVEVDVRALASLLGEVLLMPVATETQRETSAGDLAEQFEQLLGESEDSDLSCSSSPVGFRPRPRAALVPWLVALLSISTCVSTFVAVFAWRAETAARAELKRERRQKK